jgi:hypothetical protein
MNIPQEVLDDAQQIADEKQEKVYVVTTDQYELGYAPIPLSEMAQDLLSDIICVRIPVPKPVQTEIIIPGVSYTDLLVSYSIMKANFTGAKDAYNTLVGEVEDLKKTWEDSGQDVVIEGGRGRDRSTIWIYDQKDNDEITEGFEKLSTEELDESNDPLSHYQIPEEINQIVKSL